ncbi:MAG: tRNA (adenosine(37)-N6)-threonylcarbamoyltransferase complex transferase subunit TsaD [Candidatus Magnetoovum sp. WYHC-5]|nr:tRNA (adenosine(37)-N6)-threonylcarbamoyltransferase complex transferase subunit TsaD [Candidatus Magnetoovum sp. WYHC-5]
MPKERKTIILAIDTSCDDTSAAVISGEDFNMLSNIVSSQSEIHRKYGGIVPELASRRHMELIWPVVNEALSTAEITLSALNAISVCYGPGLIGSLIVGSSFAKALAYAASKPLIGVNHLEGHMFSPFLSKEERPTFPFICLIVSGGHTSLYRVEGFARYSELGRTRDDAVGEAYDKVAKMLGLSYPGGPIIDSLAKKGNASAIKFPRPFLNGSLDFSFSGLKTAVRSFIAAKEFQAVTLEDVCASFQESVIDVLLKKVDDVIKMEKIYSLVLAGGVAANSLLRQKMTALSQAAGFSLFLPPLKLCTDNAAMIAVAGYFYYQEGLFANMNLTPKAYLPL